MDSRERFLEKARTWPRVETAAQLAGLLSGVKPRRWREYSHVANPPCHASSSGESFAFGDAPGGGLRVYCWACGSETLERAETALGVALQTRRQGGSLRYRDGSGRPQPPPAKYIPSSKTFHAVPLEGEVTVRDFFAAPVWLASVGKGKPATARRGREAWRQSRSPDHGGVRLARYGGQARDTGRDGRPYTFRVLPWASYDEILRIIADPARDVAPGAEPMVSLAGDEDTPFPGDFLLIDFDYSPGRDPEGHGAGIRDTVRRRLAEAGASVYRSRGGHGFHAVLRMAAADILAGRWPRKKRVETEDFGVALDIFPPGFRAPVNLSRERPLDNTAPDHALPALTLAELDAVLSGQDAGQDREPSVSERLDEAQAHAAEPEYARLLVETAEELAREQGASVREWERIHRYKKMFAMSDNRTK